ncbi:MAG: ASKHA domain-containing protein [Clostridiales bacterium]
MEYNIKFESHDISENIEGGKTILEAAALASIPIEGNCGGAGNCKKCQVAILDNKVFAANAIPALSKNKPQMVLACKYKIHSDLTINVPIQNDAFKRKTTMNFQNKDIKPNSSIGKSYIELDKPSINNQIPDYERIVTALNLKPGNPSKELLQILPRVLRDSKFSITAVTRDNELIWVEPGDTTAENYGLVYDIGTTTVVCHLINLTNGAIEKSTADTNPQNIFGADVISRVNHVMTNSKNNKGLNQLYTKINTVINALAVELIRKKSIDKNRIYDVTVVGNTTMSQLFMGVDPTYLATSPFIPTYVQGVNLKASELNLDINPTANVFLLPNIAGYVGSDTVGVILATHLHKQPEYSLAIDVGTNGELALSGNGKILTCSTAAGPAFEGAQIKCGMRAAEGAIEAVYIDNETGTCTYETIGNTKPKGICGSGVLDVVAQLYKSGILDKFGAFRFGRNNDGHINDKLKERISKGDHGYEFVLATAKEAYKGIPIVICQKDIRELQMGKGAIYAGIKILMKEMNITVENLQKIMIAGAFGNYIKVESALAIGLLPNITKDKISSVGNAASEGARLALISKDERELGCELAKRCKHIELSSYEEFQNEYMNALNFPEI